MDLSEEDGLRLVTPRLVLRAMMAADASAFHALVTRPEVARMLFIFPTDWPLAAAAPFIEAWRWQGKLLFRIAIYSESRKTRDLMG